MRIFEITQPAASKPPAGTRLPMILYHGSNTKIKKFNAAPQGTFFSPHKEWASNYGDVITSAYVWAPKVYTAKYNDPYGELVLDALFDRDYVTLAKFVKELQAQGYYALQTQTDSEMVCAFSNAKIYPIG